MLKSSLSSSNTGYHASHRHPLHIPRKQQHVGHVVTHKNPWHSAEGICKHAALLDMAGAVIQDSEGTDVSQLSTVPLKHVLDTR